VTTTMTRQRRRLPLRLRLSFCLLGVIGMCAVAPGVVVAVAPGAPSPSECSLRAADGTYRDRLAPSAEHWFGTDVQGCDSFSRVVYGARHSVLIGAGTSLLVLTLGMVLGVAAGWRGGRLDAFVSRAGDVVLGVPLAIGMIFLLTLVLGGRRSTLVMVLAFASLLWPTVARLARAATLTIKPVSFIEAARAAGASDLGICMRHVVPTALPAVAAFSSSMAGLLIGAEASLSYIGLGVDRSVVSWGQMLDAAQPYFVQSPHLLLFPSFFLAAASAGFLLLGESFGAQHLTLDQRR